MEINKAAQAENRSEFRFPTESGATVIIHDDDREILGTLENKSDAGLGLSIPSAYQKILSPGMAMSLTYNMPYGLVSEHVRICWIRPDQNGRVKIGTSLIDPENQEPTRYQKLWKSFVEAESLEDAARFWLSLQSAMISGVTRGFIALCKTGADNIVPISFWPDGQRGTLGLTEVASMALHEKRGVLKDEGHYHKELNLRVCNIGFPLMQNESIYGVVAIEIAVRPEPLMRAVMRQLQWGSVWVELIIRRLEGKKYTPENQQLVTVLELIATSLEHERFQSAATSVATEIATLLNCERVSLGFLKGKNIQIKALSHSSDFAKKSKLIQNIGQAMEESIDQLTSLIYPPLSETSINVVRFHERLIKEQGSGSVCTIPLSCNGKPMGALTLERPVGSSFSQGTVELCETIAALVGPILDAKRREDQWIIAKIGSSATDFVSRLIGPSQAGLKMASFLTVAALLFLGFATGDYRIAADTHLEGAIQRAIVTPFDGYIGEAYVRAGDEVPKDTPLAKLDDTDLVLERTKWESQRQQYLKEYRDALGKADRSKVTVLSSQLKQAEAQLEIIEAQLSRIHVKAPFDGIIVTGDLSQSLGSPSQRGDVLFEIAPLNAYRAVLEVDESDISDLAVGQTGEMVLTGRSDSVIPFKVARITPVSESKDGRTFFRVEADLIETSKFLRPGMKGVAKIFIDERKLVWIWTRTLMDWLRLKLWTWWPEGL